MDKNITIRGLDNFKEKEVEKIKEIVSLNYEKLKRGITGNLVLDAKKHNKDGNRALYSFHGKIQTPENLINVKSSDWELEKAVHILMNKFQASAQNKLRK